MNTTTRRNTRQSQNQTPSSGSMLFTGFVLGLIVSGAIYFIFDGDSFGNRITKNAQPQKQQKKSEDESILPRFEFYSVLPELEVVIPEQFTETLREVLPQSQEETKKTTEKKAEQTAAENSGETYFIQAGSFKKQKDAERMKIKLLLLGLDVNVQGVEVQGKKYHRVRIGPLADYQSFETARDRLKENDINYMVLKSKKK